MKMKVTPFERKRLDLDPEFIHLNRNMLMGMHPKNIYDGMIGSIREEGISRYPDGIEYIYDKLSGYIGYPSENILITWGVEGGFKAVLETYDLVGESIGILTPTCATTGFIYPTVFSVNVVNVSGDAPDYQIPVEKILDIIPKIKVLFLDNPKSHIETYLNSDEVWEIVNCAEYHGVLVFLDEIYCGFGTEEFLQVGSFDITRFENLIISSSFSKTHMLPGLKFGWLVTSENILNEIESARFIYETNNPTMDMVDYVCNNPEYFDYFRESVMIKRTDIMKKMLLNEQANISSHAKSFKPYGEFT